MWFAVHIGKRKVRRFKRLQIIILRFRPRPEIPSGGRIVMRDSLMQHSRKRTEIEPLRITALSEEFRFACRWKREAELFAADSLWFYNETSGAGQVSERNPKIIRSRDG